MRTILNGQERYRGKDSGVSNGKKEMGTRGCRL